MTKSVKIGLRILTGSIVILTIVLLLLVRFTDGTIKGGDKIILGYDEGEGKFQFLEKRLHELKGVDGPYIIGDELITITGQNKLKKSILRSDAVEVTVRNKDKDRFTVPLKQHFVPPPDEYAMPDQLIAISDIEGNFDGFSGFLQKNKVIDDQFNWIYGEGHLVLIGDFVDRGNNVLPILWLIYKLEIEAAEAGGKVHYILGNHEIMNIQGDFSYAQNKYRKIAAMIGGQKASIDNNKILFSANSHLGKWIRDLDIFHPRSIEYY